MEYRKGTAGVRSAYLCASFRIRAGVRDKEEEEDDDDDEDFA